MKRSQKPAGEPVTWLLDGLAVRFAWWASIKTWSWLIIGSVMTLAMAFVFAVRLLTAILLRVLRR